MRTKIKKYNPVKRKFAFLPIRIGNYIVWLESYYEKRERSEFLEFLKITRWLKEEYKG